MESERPLRILFLSPFYDDRSGPVESLDRFPVLAALPRELQRRGHQVRVLGLASTTTDHIKDGVKYRWITAPGAIRRAGTLAHQIKPYYGPAYYQPSLRLARAAESLDADIVHVFGLTMDLHLGLSRLVGGSGAKRVAHYHGGEPATGTLRRRLQAFALAGVDAALFTSLDQAEPWLAAGMLQPAQIHQIIETSSPFNGIAREIARAQTGMTGAPVYLSAGRLHPIKDPLTMLRGFAHITHQQPDARLYLYYTSEELLLEARALVHSLPRLRSRVEFRGRAELREMEAIYSSADILLQGSLREWSGLAILEAMSCGAIPVVTDISSFRMMTQGNRYGRLFDPGDAASLAAAALSINEISALSAHVKSHFEEQLSFQAMARDLERVYRELRATE